MAALGDANKAPQELGNVKRDPTLKVDASGAIRLGSQPQATTTSLATDLRIKYALQRRGLALSQARLMTFGIHDQWVERLLRLVMRPPPAGYSQVDFAQVALADKELWSLMGERCRSGIQPRPDGSYPPSRRGHGRLLAVPRRDPLAAAAAVWLSLPRLGPQQPAPCDAKVGRIPRGWQEAQDSKGEVRTSCGQEAAASRSPTACG